MYDTVILTTDGLTSSTKSAIERFVAIFLFSRLISEKVRLAPASCALDNCGKIVNIKITRYNILFITLKVTSIAKTNMVI